MKHLTATILKNEPVSKNVMLMTLSGGAEAITAPGQFINIKLDGYYLRRPISVCDAGKTSLTIIYKVVGRGTAAMAAMKEGGTLDILAGLGNGYDLASAGEHPVLIGGGAGVPPMYYLAKQLMTRCKKVTVILGFNTADEIFFEREFSALGAEVLVTTADGSCGIKGFATDALPETYSYTYACGPEPMLKAVYKASKTSGEYSFEQRMGCGFGACMGCTCRTVSGYKRICKDGPVLKKEEILWQTSV